MGGTAEIWPQGDNLGSRLKEAEVSFICTDTKGLLYVRPYCVNMTCLVRSSRKTFGDESRVNFLLEYEHDATVRLWLSWVPHLLSCVEGFNGDTVFRSMNPVKGFSKGWGKTQYNNS